MYSQVAGDTEYRSTISDVCIIYNWITDSQIWRIPQWVCVVVILVVTIRILFPNNSWKWNSNGRTFQCCSCVNVYCNIITNRRKDNFRSSCNNIINNIVLDKTANYQNHYYYFNTELLQHYYFVFSLQLRQHFLA